MTKPIFLIFLGGYKISSDTQEMIGFLFVRMTDINSQITTRYKHEQSYHYGQPFWLVSVIIVIVIPFHSFNDNLILNITFWDLLTNIG